MADELKALVGNAADSEQVEKASKREKITRRTQLEDLRAVLSTKSGRRFVWRLLEHCRTFESIFSPNDAIMAHGSGSQDVGHFLMAEIVQAQPEALITMMKAKHEELA